MIKMKIRPQLEQMISRALLLAALLGLLFPGRSLPAQTATRKVESRFLLVFDTSAEMKRRLPAVQKAVSGLLMASTANGELRAGDSLGVWTFDQDLRTGQFPLQRWTPEGAAVIASNVNAFVGTQRFSKKTRLAALIPLLTQVVSGSERLTVVIFCDGYGELNGTPYDTGINQIFRQRQAERQKARLPFVVVMRSQLGQFVDCMVSFPPQSVSLPAFPPLPAPPPPRLTPATAPPRPVAPPLIIIGTPPPTNRVPPPPPTPTNPPPVAVTSAPEPPPVAEAPLPNDLSPTRTNVAPTRLTITPELLPQTNSISAPAAGSGADRKRIGKLGIVSLVAVGVTAFVLGRIFLKKVN